MQSKKKIRYSRRGCETTGWQAFWLSGALHSMTCFAKAEPRAITISCEPLLFIIEKCDASVVNDALSALRLCLLANLALFASAVGLCSRPDPVLKCSGDVLVLSCIYFAFGTLLHRCFVTIGARLGLTCSLGAQCSQELIPLPEAEQKTTQSQGGSSVEWPRDESKRRCQPVRLLQDIPPLSLVSGGGTIRLFLPISYWSERTWGGVSFRKESIIMFSFFLFQRSIVFTVRLLCFLATRKAEDV